MKKYLFLFSAFLLSASLLFGQTPDKMSYQSVVRDASSNLLADRTIGMRIQILKGDEFGSAVYVETQKPKTNANGLVSIIIGDGTIVRGSLNSINWSNDKYYIKTEIDPNGGSSYSLNGVGQFLSVPYSRHAKSAESLSQPLQYNELIDKPSIKDSVEKYQKKYQLGDILYGGVVFYVDETGQHGMVVHPLELGPSKWTPTNTEVGASARASGYGLGLSNTMAILGSPGVVSGDNANCAAVAAVNLINSSAFPWHLPNMGELNKLFSNMDIVNANLSRVPGNSDKLVFEKTYWSATEWTINSAVSSKPRRASNGAIQGVIEFKPKSESHAVRAILVF